MMAATILSISDPDRKGAFASRFWSKVDRRGPAECWPWTAKAVHHGGYGAINAGAIGAGKLRAHRVTYEMAHGAIPDGLVVCHRCDNPKCCNPAHLFIGTKADNTHDMMAKGRMKKPPVLSGDAHPLRRDPSRAKRGASNGNSKITPEVAASIWHANDGLAAIAARFGVSTGTVSDIKAGRTWRHLTKELAGATA